MVISFAERLVEIPAAIGQNLRQGKIAAVSQHLRPLGAVFGQQLGCQWVLRCAAVLQATLICASILLGDSPVKRFDDRERSGPSGPCNIDALAKQISKSAELFGWNAPSNSGSD